MSTIFSLDTLPNPLYHPGMHPSAAYLCYVATLLMILISAPHARANDGVGTTAFSFIKIVPGARQAAAAGALSAVAGDVNALYWNPAALARLTSGQVTVSYSSYFKDVQFGFVGYARPLGVDQVVGIGVQYLSFGSFRETSVSDPLGVRSGTFSAGDLAVTFSYSRPAGDYASFGFNLKTLHERIQDFSATALALDVGTHIRIPAYRLSAAVVMQHVGYVASRFVNGRKAPLPSSIRTGIGYRPKHLPLLISVDVEKARRRPVVCRLGGEFNIRDIVFVRGGFASSGGELRLESSDTRLMGISGGLGFRSDVYCLDYAYTPALRLGDIHRVSLTYQFE